MNPLSSYPDRRPFIKWIYRLTKWVLVPSILLFMGWACRSVVSGVLIVYKDHEMIQGQVVHEGEHRTILQRLEANDARMVQQLIDLKDSMDKLSTFLYAQIERRNIQIQNIDQRLSRMEGHHIQRSDLP